MNTKTSYFNKHIFIKSLKKLIPFMLLLFSFLLLLELSMGSSFFGYMSHSELNTQSRLSDFSYEFLDTACAGISKVIFTGYSFCVAVFVFSYLFSKKQGTTIHSLPLTRSCLYISNICSGMCAILIPVVCSGILLGIYILVHGCSIAILPVWIAAITAYCLIFFALGVLACMLCGHIIAIPIIYVLLNFGILVLQALLGNCFSMLYFGLSDINLDEIHTFSSPFLKLLDDMHAANLHIAPSNAADVALSYSGVYTLIIYTVISIVILVLCGYFYKKRALELTGDPIVIKWLQPILLYAGTFAGGCIGSVLLYNIIYNSSMLNCMNLKRWIIFCALFIICSVIVYFVICMLLHKTVRIFSQNYRGIIVFSLIAIACSAILRLDLFHIEARIPDQADIKSVALSYYDSESKITDKEQIKDILALHRKILSEKEALCQSLTDNQGSWYSCTINYTLKNGKTLKRIYYLGFNYNDTDDTYEYSKAVRSVRDDINEIINNPALMLATLERITPNMDSYTIDRIYRDKQNSKYDVTLYNSEDWSRSSDDLLLLDAIKADIKEGHMLYYMFDEPDENALYYVNLFSYGKSYLAATGSPLYESVNLCYNVTTDCTHTLEAIQKIADNPKNNTKE